MKCSRLRCPNNYIVHCFFWFYLYSNKNNFLFFHCWQEDRISHLRFYYQHEKILNFFRLFPLTLRQKHSLLLYPHCIHKNRLLCLKHLSNATNPNPNPNPNNNNNNTSLQPNMNIFQLFHSYFRIYLRVSLTQTPLFCISLFPQQYIRKFYRDLHHR